MDAEPTAASASWLPLTVTVRAVLQPVVVKLSVPGSTVASPLAVTVTSTASVGCESSSTSYVPVPPSRTVSAVWLTLTPRVSSSVIVTVSPAVGLTVRPDVVVALTVTVSSASSTASSTGSSVKVPVPLASPAAIVTVTSSTAVKSSPAVAVPPATDTVTAVAVPSVAPSSVAVTSISSPLLESSATSVSSTLSAHRRRCRIVVGHRHGHRGPATFT